MEKKVHQLPVNAPGARSLAPGLLPGIKPNDLKEMRCKNCKCESFIGVTKLMLASPLQTQMSQPLLVNFNAGFACMKCGNVNNLEEITNKMRMEEQTPPKEEQN